MWGKLILLQCDDEGNFDLAQPRATEEPKLNQVHYNIMGVYCMGWESGWRCHKSTNREISLLYFNSLLFMMSEWHGCWWRWASAAFRGLLLLFLLNNHSNEKICIYDNLNAQYVWVSEWRREVSFSFATRQFYRPPVNVRYRWNWINQSLFFCLIPELKESPTLRWNHQRNSLWFKYNWCHRTLQFEFDWLPILNLYKFDAVLIECNSLQ